MDVLQKLAFSASEAHFEADGTELPHQPKNSHPQACGWTTSQIREAFGKQSYNEIVRAKGHSIPIHLAAVPGGRRFPLLKVMLTTACEHNCFYCPFRAGRNHRRVTFQPDELAHTIIRTHSAGLIERVFLSTGIFNGGANTQNKLLDTAVILRKKLDYHGYLHIKIMPGAEHGQVLQAMRLADRISTNLEAPNPPRLNTLAPEKDFERELLRPLRWAHELRRSTSSRQGWQGRWPSTTTQFVVGAAGESDLELLSTVEYLFRQLRLMRVYFEAFSPVHDTPMESHPPENVVRQQRLYEASFLLRDYGFDLDELPFTLDGKLPLHKDPKQAYADQELRAAPIELNIADRDSLLRVPGIGPQTADRLLTLRRQGRLRDLDLLRSQHLISERSAPYILLDGKQPTHQPKLFSSRDLNL